MAQVGGHADTEPDLTAMLDVVLQILMYFIVTANFIDQERNPDLELPVAQVAKPVSGDRDYLALSIPKWLLIKESFTALEKQGMPPDVVDKLRGLRNQQFATREGFTNALKKLLSDDEFVNFQQAIFKESEKPKLVFLNEEPKDMDSVRLWLSDKELTLKAASADNTIHTMIKVRAHKNVEFDVVYQFMQLCKEKGFKQFSMQVFIGDQ